MAPKSPLDFIEGLIDPRGVVVVLNAPRLARDLHNRGRNVIACAPQPATLRRVAATRMCCAADALPFAYRSLAAAVIGEPCADALPSIAPALLPGSHAILVHRSRAADRARDALCAGLTDIRQMHFGRTILTSGCHPATGADHRSALIAPPPFASDDPPCPRPDR